MKVYAIIIQIAKGGKMEKDNKTVLFQVRITKELKDSINKLAEDLKIRPSQAARMILAQGVKNASEVNNGQ